MWDGIRKWILGAVTCPLWRIWERLCSILISAKIGEREKPASPQLMLEPDEWKRQHDECSMTVRRVLLTIISFSVFCALILGKLDVALLGVGTPIKLPFAGVDVTFQSFLFTGPVFPLWCFLSTCIFLWGTG